MKTYSINTMGGQIARGIPSRDVAIAIAADMLRYDDNYDDALEDWERDMREGPEYARAAPTWRQHVTITQESYDEDLLDYVSGRTYVILTTEAEHRGFGVHEEAERCDHCGRLPGRPLPGSLW